MARPESQNSKRERPVRRTGIIYMRKKDLFDALKEMFKRAVTCVCQNPGGGSSGTGLTKPESSCSMGLASIQTKNGNSCRLSMLPT